MNRTTNKWIDEYKKKGALWIHDENPKRPHALLTSGFHSNGFFNSRLVIPDEPLLREAAADLVELFEARFGNKHAIDVVVGPQTGATKLAEFISDSIANLRERPCEWASPAKFEAGGVKEMKFEKQDDTKLNYEVLLCEDVLTTGGSVELTEKEVEKLEGKVLPFILVLVNRSGLKSVGGKVIVALIDHLMPMWDPSECELCLVGSEAVRPKDNWDRLNADY